MLARRMLTFVAVLLALTALAAAFAPPPPADLGTGDAPAPPAASASSTDVVEVELDADTVKGRTITLDEGDRLHLEVTGEALDAVELRGLAGVRPLGPGAVAVFDVIVEEPGSYPVVLTESDRTIATVEVSPPPRQGLAPAERLTRRTRDT